MNGSDRTARLTGLAYLGLAACGLVGFLLVRGRLYAPGDAGTTAARLVAQEGLARLGLAADLGVVLTQALAALGFLRVFRRVDGVAAASIAAFGLVNAVVVLVATVFSATALEVALAGAAGPSTGTGAGTGTGTGTGAAQVQLLYQLEGATWRIGGLFFGLWLIPMGLAAVRSGAVPPLLGRLLVVGGVGYLLSTFVSQLAPDVPAVADLLVVPASLGEFWMIGHLLLRGAGARQRVAAPA
jgi:hypothetical protein